MTKAPLSSFEALGRLYGRSLRGDVAVSALCYSAQAFSPFLGALGPEALDASVIERLSSLRPDQRLLAEYAHALIELAERTYRQPGLGVAASEFLTRGDAGLFDYLVGTVDTPFAALRTAERFLRLLSDLHQLTLFVEHEHAIVRITTRAKVPRAVEEFVVATLLRNHVGTWAPDVLAETDAWFCHDAPSDASAYHRALGKTRLHFGARASGFRFPARYLDLPLADSDRQLHEVLRTAAEDKLAPLPEPHCFRDRVRMLVCAQLGVAPLALSSVANELGVKPRSLSRRLASEGTSFERIVLDVRRRTAIRHVAHSDAPLDAIATLVGYSCAPPFHRAFRRWTGETPVGFRRRHRGVLRG